MGKHFWQIRNFEHIELYNLKMTEKAEITAISKAWPASNKNMYIFQYPLCEEFFFDLVARCLDKSMKY